ncbi:hypothetical protein BMT54_03640 [Pasteurellaceae bacterium 15-036681]|nr:hypothetical protein BMT54_03640 [Pasteurellaceae bacterium 15-036681]
MKKVITCTLIATLLSACSVTHQGSMKLKEQSLTSIESKIIPNQTTKTDMRELLGEPTKITQHSNLDEIWFYNSYDEHKNYTPTVMFPVTLPLSIVFGVNMLKPITTKENEKQLRVKIDTSTNKVTNVSTAITNNDWY